jgi:hypothetical protein
MKFLRLIDFPKGMMILCHHNGDGMSRPLLLKICMDKNQNEAHGPLTRVAIVLKEPLDHLVPLFIFSLLLVALAPLPPAGLNTLAVDSSFGVSLD